MDEYLFSILGGCLIGLAASMLWLLNGRVSGISGILGGLRAAGGERLWRVFFLAGLVLGGVAWYAFDPTLFRDELGRSMFFMIPAGFLVGFGTTLGSGCTSGHGVCGVARLSKRSIGATLTFLGAGILCVFVVNYLTAGWL